MYHEWFPWAGGVRLFANVLGGGTFPLEPIMTYRLVDKTYYNRNKTVKGQCATPCIIAHDLRLGLTGVKHTRT